MSGPFDSTVDPALSALTDEDVDQLLGQIVQQQMARACEHVQMHHSRAHVEQIQVQQIAVPARLPQFPHSGQLPQIQVPSAPVAPIQVPQSIRPSPVSGNMGISDFGGMSQMIASAPQPVPSGQKVYCPLRTELAHSCQEAAAKNGGAQVGEIKAYKLGKKRWSYNQVDVVLKEKGGKRELYSKQAIHKGMADTGLGEMGGISYQVTMNNDEVIQVHTFLVYEDGVAIGEAGKLLGSSEPSPVCGSDNSEDSDITTNRDKNDKNPKNDTINYSHSNDAGFGTVFGWELVNREDCKRGCRGSTLRALQRFGRLGKRTGSNCNTPRSASASQVNSAASTPAGGAATTGGKIERSLSNMKDSRYMYLSLDEAVTHCSDVMGSSKSNNARCFRLVCGAYSGTELISTSVSPPIRVLANNDVPGGAAHIEIQLEVDSSWSGWNSSFEPLELQFSQGISHGGRSMSMSMSQGGMSGMPSANQHHSGSTQPTHDQGIQQLDPLPTLDLPSPSTRDIGRIYSDGSLITPQRLGTRLRKTMSVSSGQKRVSSLLGNEEDDLVLRRTQSMKKGKQTINLTARTGLYDTTDCLASPFVKMRDRMGHDGISGVCEVGDVAANTHHQDAVSAFVDLMMTTFDASPNGDGREQVPVVEIPKKPSPLNLAAIDDPYLDSILGSMGSGADLNAAYQDVAE